MRAIGKDAAKEMNGSAAIGARPAGDGDGSPGIGELHKLWLKRKDREVVPGLFIWFPFIWFPFGFRCNLCRSLISSAPVVAAAAITAIAAPVTPVAAATITTSTAAAITAASVAATTAAAATVTTASVATATAAAVAATSVAAATATIAPVTTTAIATAAILFVGLFYRHLFPTDRGIVQCFDRTAGLGLVGHIHEAEAFAFPCLPVHYHLCKIHRAI
jgi:hypothetical protein